MNNNAFQNDRNSLFLRDMDKRTARFRRNENLDSLLEELSRYLNPLESEIENRFSAPLMPPLLLLGNPRSGTTVFMHFLSLTEQFAIPTNLLSRFYYAPYLGAKIQLLLTDRRFDYKGELTELSDSVAFSSSLGKTVGTLAPSEFFHFWRRFLSNYDPEFLDEDQCSRVDQDGLCKGVAAIEHVFEKPFAAKAIIMQYNLDLLSSIFENGLMLYIKRNPLFIMQSILRSREDFYGRRDIWWSVKPKEYERLKDMDVYHQIAGQVYFTEMAVEKGLLHISDRNQLTIEYESLCEDPEEVYMRIVEKYAVLGCELNPKYNGPKSFVCYNKISLSKKDIDSLQSAYADFASGQIIFK